MAYQKQDIQIRPRSDKQVNFEISPELSYRVKKDTGLYQSPKDLKAFDELEKGSVVKVIETSDDKYALVDYNGSIGYVLKEVLEDF